MPKKKKSPQDENEIAFGIMSKLTGDESPPQKKPAKKPPEEKSSSFSSEQISKVMSEMGRKGGLKGGKARAEKLSAKKRKEIAKKAAEARWKKNK